MMSEILGPKERAALAQVVALIRKILIDCARYIIQTLPFIVRALAIGAGLTGATIAVFQTWLTFGQDAAAFVLGFAVGVIPFIYALTRGIVSYGGMLASGAVSAVIGLTFYVLPLLYSNIIIVFVLGVLLVLQMSRRNTSEETLHEQG